MAGSPPLTQTEERLRHASVVLSSLPHECLYELLRGDYLKEVDLEEAEADSLVLVEECGEVQVFGEAALLGLPAAPLMLRGPAKALSRADFQSALKGRRIFEGFVEEAQELVSDPLGNPQEPSGQRLLACMSRCLRGKKDEHQQLLKSARLVLLKPGQCLEGLHLILAGRLRMAGVLRGPGQAFHGGVAHGGPALCAQLPPEAEELWDESEARRHHWVAEVALPALRSCQLLAGCPDGFLESLARQLQEEEAYEDQEIVPCNASGDSMFVVLEGTVLLTAKSGREIGRLQPCGSFGEAEALGLLSYRTCSAHASGACRVLPVPRQALQRALEEPSTPNALKEGFAQLLTGRRKQVQERQPLAALMHLKSEEDVGANLLSLRAERLPVEPGSCWSPSEGRLSFILHGRVELELSGLGEPVEVHVRPGSVVTEGLLPAGALLRAVSGDCEVYRVWHYDLLQAAFITPQAPDWFYQLRVLEQETKRWLLARLANARGLLQNRGKHPTDELIRGWAKKKQERLRRAQERQEQHAESYLGPKLPLLPPKQFNTTAFRSWGDLPQPTQRPRGKVPSLSAFRALRLVRSEPRFKALK